MMNILWSPLHRVLRREKNDKERCYKGSEWYAFWVWLFCSFCMFITTTLKYLMWFTLTKFHYSKYNFTIPTISLQYITNSFRCNVLPSIYTGILAPSAWLQRSLYLPVTFWSCTCKRRVNICFIDLVDNGVPKFRHNFKNLRFPGV
jgi:hypothetical protein